MENARRIFVSFMIGALVLIIELNVAEFPRSWKVMTRGQIQTKPGDVREKNYILRNARK